MTWHLHSFKTSTTWETDPLPGLAASMTYSLGCLWTTASKCWSSGNTTHAAGLFLIMADSSVPADQNHKFLIQNIDGPWWPLGDAQNVPLKLYEPGLESYSLLFIIFLNSHSSFLSSEYLKSPSTILPKTWSGLSQAVFHKPGINICLS